MIDGAGGYNSVLVGPVLDIDMELEQEPVLQYLVPRDTWFASELGRILKILNLGFIIHFNIQEC